MSSKKLTWIACQHFATLVALNYFRYKDDVSRYVPSLPQKRNTVDAEALLTKVSKSSMASPARPKLVIQLVVLACVMGIMKKNRKKKFNVQNTQPRSSVT